MKRALSVILSIAILLVAVAALPLTASAANEPTLTVEFSPTSLTGAGKISISCALTAGDADISDCMLSIPGMDDTPIGNLSAGQTQPITIESYDVSADQLGKDIVIKVSYEIDGTAGQVSKAIRVEKKAANVKVVTKASVDKSTVPKDTDVKFSFAVENQGDVAIKDVQIKASNINKGNVIGGKFDLEPGKTKVLEYTGNIVKDMEIQPTITYTANGETKKENMDKISIKCSDAALSVEATPEATELEPGQDTSVSIKVSNTGNVKMENISLFDSNGNSVPIEASTLEAGKSATAKSTVSLDKSGQIGYYVTAKDSAGKEYKFNSNVIEMTVKEPEATPEPEPTPEATDYEDMLALEVEEKFDEEGTGAGKTFDITLTNNGEETFTNLVVTENIYGNIGTISSLPGGESKSVSKTLDITESGSLVFMVSAVDPNGEKIVVKAEPYTVNLEGGENLSDKKGGGTTDTLLIIIIIVVVLIIATGIVLIIFIFKDRKAKQVGAMDKPAKEAGGIRPAKREVTARAVTEAGRAPRDPRASRGAEVMQNNRGKNPDAVVRTRTVSFSDVGSDIDEIAQTPVNREGHTARPRQDAFPPEDMRIEVDEPAVKSAAGEEPVQQETPAVPKPISRRSVGVQKKQPPETFDDRNMF